jgi:hypothetical protein|nr:MAG TPA: hypothetical protein [Caudoviricetes sp.]
MKLQQFKDITNNEAYVMVIENAEVLYEGKLKDLNDAQLLNAKIDKKIRLFEQDGFSEELIEMMDEEIEQHEEDDDFDFEPEMYKVVM